MTLEHLYGADVVARMARGLPAGYSSYRQCRAYFERERAASPGTEVVGEEGAWGTRWTHGPFRFEKFTTDQEPRVAGGPPRMTIWQPVVRTERPRGWLPGWADMSIRMTGVAPLDAGARERWSPHALRHLRRWRAAEAEGWSIRQATLDEFLAGLRSSDQDALLKAAFAAIVRGKARAHGPLLRLTAAIDPQGAVRAGLACLDVPEVSQAVHVASFLHESAKPADAGTGLIDRWFLDATDAGWDVLDLGLFWSPGDPRSWQGFSRFKSQFGVRLIRFPRPLFRFSGRFFGR